MTKQSCRTAFLSMIEALTLIELMAVRQIKGAADHSAAPLVRRNDLFAQTRFVKGFVKTIPSLCSGPLPVPLPESHREPSHTDNSGTGG